MKRKKIEIDKGKPPPERPLNKVLRDHSSLVNHNGNLLKEKTILVVNTGSLKKKFILQRIKKLGLRVICLNKEKNWAQPYVDHFILANTYNHNEAIQKLEMFLEGNPEIKIDGCLTFWEDDVLLTAKIIDKFKFIGIPYSVAKKTRNKYLFRKFCQENNLPFPHHKIIKSVEDLRYCRRHFDFPLVVKPIYGCASAYVIKINDYQELEETYDFLKKNLSTDVESALSDGSGILVEEYISGNEVDIDMLVQNGKLKFYSISDNDKTKEPFFVETGQTIPSTLPLSNQQQLISTAEETLEKLGVQNGCIHFEAKSTKKGPYPIEVNLRMGGDEVYSFVKGAWNVDLIENALKIACGLYLKINKPSLPKKYITGQYFLSDYSGVLVESNIDEDINKKKYLEELHFFKDIGDPILTPPAGYDFLGWITVSGDNLVNAKDNLKEAMDYIDYRVVKFDTASSIGKTARKNRFSSAVLNKNLLLGAARFEFIKRTKRSNQKKLHIGIACNFYEENNIIEKEVEVDKELTDVGKNIEKTLKDRGYQVTFFDFNNLPKAFNELCTKHVDLVFNVCERINDSSLLEPHAASILDTLQIPYTGSNPFTLALCIDKIRVKKLLAFHNIPTPKWDYLYLIDDELRDDLKYPLIVKPGNTDNSIGITNESVVTNKKELQRQLEKIIVQLGRPALIEEFIEGDEYDVSILGSEPEDLRCLPLYRSIFKDLPKGYWHIYPYNAKWTDDPVYKKIIRQMPPKNISQKLQSLISEIALDTYNILDCHDYGRVEIRVDQNNNPYVLELNPNPSINIGDCVPKAAALIGMEYGDFLEEIIYLAIKRYQNRPSYYHLQTNLL